MPTTIKEWVPLLGTLTVLLGAAWVVLRVVAKLQLREEQPWIEERAHRVVSERLKDHNADQGAHAVLLASLTEAVNETRERTAEISGTLAQLVNSAGRRDGDAFVCPLGKLHEKLHDTPGQGEGHGP